MLHAVKSGNMGLVSDSLKYLIDLLDLEPIEVNIFRGHRGDENRQRVFGGQVASQALMAAGKTVSNGLVHSLHSYFLRPGDPTTPILYEVDRIRDGRSFATRRVVAIQHGEAIFNMQCSFHADERGLEHQVTMPEVPAADAIPPLAERLAPWRDQLSGWYSTPHPIDQRYLGKLPWREANSAEELTEVAPRQQLWIKADGALPDDALLHACVATYASDLTLFDTILAPHPIAWDDPEFMGASLDHCMWFHREFRADEWLLYDTDSPIAHSARGLARGFLFNEAGELCVSMVQEGLARLI